MTTHREVPVRRSELVCPAHSMKMMVKAAASDADEVIFDLEDACAVSQKVGARATLIEALRTLDFGGKVRAFRPNALSSPYFYRDLIEVVEAAGRFIDCVVIPKVDAPEDVRFVDRLLGQIEAHAKLAIGRIRIEALIESARGVLAAQAIATSSPRLESLIFGVADYAGDVGARDANDPFQWFHYPKAHLVAAARAAGILVIDQVTVQLRDLELVAAEAKAAARMGFDGKWAIHPTHLRPIHEAFTPSREELERAIAIIAAYRRADRAEGVGAIVFGDEMVDAASLKIEQRRLEVARRAGLIDEAGNLLAPH